MLHKTCPFSAPHESFRIAGKLYEVVNRIPYLMRGLNHAKPPLRAFEGVVVSKKAQYVTYVDGFMLSCSVK